MTDNKKAKNICVFCSSSDAVSEVYFQAAEELGKLLAANDCRLIYGGANLGLMGTLAKSAYHCGAQITGVIPEFFVSKNLAYDKCAPLIVTKNMRERKSAMEDAADAFIAMPGGFGTLEEILEIITLKQIKQHNKAIVFINTNGYYQHLFAHFEHSFSSYFSKSEYKNLYYEAENPHDAMKYISDYHNHPTLITDKWFHGVPKRAVE